MERIRLPNGLTIIANKNNSDTVAIEAQIQVGSNNEMPRQAGISHFLEHMMLEGTESLPSAQEIANQIEKLGGELNAATINERTYIYIKLPKKHCSTAVKIMSDIIKNPLFSEQSFEKEKKVVLDEINLVTGEPRFYQWTMFLENLYDKLTVRNPIYGKTEAIKKCKLEDMKKFYKTYYVPNNMIISISGDYHAGCISELKKELQKMKRKILPAKKKLQEPGQKKKLAKKSMHQQQSYVVLGYKTPKRTEKESYALDVIRAILGRGQSGKLFDEVRNKRGLAYEIGVQHEPSNSYGFFSVYFSTGKTNVKKIMPLVMQEFQNLQELTEQELEEAKTFIEGEHIIQYEDNQKKADLLAFYEMCGDMSIARNYLKNIQAITLEEIKKVAEEYLTDDYVMIEIH